jgi:hypothetical protein
VFWLEPRFSQLRDSAGFAPDFPRHPLGMGRDQTKSRMLGQYNLFVGIMQDRGAALTDFLLA